MESTLVWILIFAGAVIGLLGLFLFASEKELRVKRSEVEALSAKLNAAAGAELGDSAADQQQVSSDLSAELTARNQELSEQITALTIQLQESHDQIADLQSAGPHPNDMETEMARLRSSHQCLQDENLQLKNQLLESKESFQTTASASLETAESYFEMEAQVRDLRDELAQSVARIQELESSQQQSPDPQSDLGALMEQQSFFLARISELETELANEREKLVDFHTTQSRLGEMELRCSEMDEDNRRLEEEIARFREQVGESDENRRRLVLVRQHLDELEMKQAALTQQHGKIQEEMAALGKFISAAPEDPLQLELSDEPFRNVGHPFEPTAEYGTPSSTEDRGREMSHDKGELNEPAESVNDPSSLRQHSQLQNKPKHAGVQSNGKQGYNYKLLVAMIPILLIAGTVVAGFLRKNPTAPEGPVASVSSSESIPKSLAESKADAQKPLAGANQSRSKDAPLASADKRREAQVPETASFGKEAQVRTISVASSAPNPRVDEGATAKSKAAPSKPAQVATQPLPRVWGGYELVRPAAVYSEPIENSQPIAKLDSGTQVNVVSARDGWLEIRSKNGRPPGFIKSDTAVRMSQN